MKRSLASKPPSAPAVSRRAGLRLALASAAAALLPGGAWAAYVVRPWPAGKPVPELDLEDLDGKRWSLAAFAGQVVILNFWATWCEPCRAEMPSLDALGARHRDAGLSVVAVNYRESAALIRRFFEQVPLRATILLDPDGDAAAEWTPRVFPSTVLLGRDGKPAATVLGDLDWASQAARKLVEPMLARPRTRRE